MIRVSRRHQRGLVLYQSGASAVPLCHNLPIHLSYPLSTIIAVPLIVNSFAHACIRMVNIGRLLLDTNFKKISSVGGEQLRLIGCIIYLLESQPKLERCS